MMHRFRPTQVARSVLDLDLPQLLDAGKRVLIFDLDNTLVRRGTKELDAGVSDYLAAVQAAGFRVGILTNRRRNAKDPIVQDLGQDLPVVSAACKPRRSGFIRMLNLMDARAEDAVMIGDRWLTDILGANCMGIYSIQVQSANWE
jgi:putative phosphatase